MISKDNVLKLMDFGLARQWSDKPEESVLLVGTPFYMAPEQILGDPLDSRTDLYATGVTLYRMVTGVLPFSEGNILRQHRLDTPKPPHTLRADLPHSASDVIMKCLEKKPSDRFSSFNEFFQAFKDSMDAEDMAPKDNAAPPQPIQPHEKDIPLASLEDAVSFETGDAINPSMKDQSKESDTTPDEDSLVPFSELSSSIQEEIQKIES